MLTPKTTLLLAIHVFQNCGKASAYSCRKNIPSKDDEKVVMTA